MEDYKKKYEDAFERAKECHIDGLALHQPVKEVIEHIFPELKESEDERIRKAIVKMISDIDGGFQFEKYGIVKKEARTWLEKQGQKQHLELKAGHWYFCHQAYCERADILTVKEGERFQCEKDGVVKGLVIKEPAKYFTECDAPAHMEIEQKPTWSEDDENLLKLSLENLTELMNRFGEKYGKVGDCIDWLKSLRQRMKV